MEKKSWRKRRINGGERNGEKNDRKERRESAGERAEREEDKVRNVEKTIGKKEEI